MRGFLVSLAALLALGAATAATGGEVERLLWENRLLQNELELAKSKKNYFIFDLEKKKILLKVKGVTLRDFPIQSATAWGDPVDAKPMVMLRKSALRPPARPELKPGEPDKPSGDSKAADDLQALELKDMPREFTLSLGNGIIVSVKNRPTGLWGRLGHWWYVARWYVAQPLLTLWHAYRRAPFTGLRIVLDEKDAQAVYWSCPEGTLVLIYRPS